MKNNSIKKIAAALAALCVGTAATVPVMVSAADLTIESTDSVSLTNKTFLAYQLFTVEEAANGGYMIDSMPDSVYNYFAGIASLNLTAIDGTNNTTKTSGWETKIANYLAGITDESSEAIELGRDLLAVAKANSITAETADETSADAVKFADLAPGYYVVENSATNDVVSSVILKTVNSDVKVDIKVDQPIIQKKIWEDDGDATVESAGNNDLGLPDGGELVDYNNASYNDTVYYQLNSLVPDTSYFTEYTYKIIDTFSEGLDFNNDVKITIGNDEIKNTAGLNDKFWVVMKDKDGNVIANPEADGAAHVAQVVIKFVDLKGLIDAGTIAADELITVTYSADVNEDAVVGETGNPNAVKLEYSSNPNASGDGVVDNEDTDEDGTPNDEDTDDDNDGTPDNEDDDDDNDGTPDDQEDADGDNTPDDEDDDTTNDDGSTTETPDDVVITYLAQIKVLKVDASGNVLPSVAEFQLLASDKTTVIYDSTAVDASGILEFKGLAEGTYYIKETKAHIGEDGKSYNLLEEPIKVTITFGDPEKAIQDGTETCSWTYNNDFDANAAEGTDGIYTINVVNRKGTIFPGTGGMGTTIFVVVGLSMMAGAVVLFTIKKKVTTK